MIYIALGVLLIISAVAVKVSKKCTDTVFLVFAGILLFVLSAFRDVSVGQDLNNYVHIYDRICNTPLRDIYHIRSIYYEIDTEIGYNYFCKFLSYISTDYIVLTAATSLISIGGAFAIIYRYSKNYYMSVMIYILFGCYFASMNTIRTSMVISILGIALQFLINKKYIKSLLFVILAATFHKLALTFLILFPIIGIKIRYRYICVIIIGCIIAFISGEEMLLWFANIFHYKSYIRFIGNGNGDGLLLMLLMICAGTAIFWKSYIISDKYAQVWVHFMAMAVVFSVLALHFNLISRIVSLFTFYVCILLPNVIHSLKKENRVWGYTLVTFAMSFYAIYYLYRLDDLNANVFPYVFRFAAI